MPRMKQEEKIAPPSAPMLHMDEPDDVRDPPVPPGLADEAMAQATPGLPQGAVFACPPGSITPEQERAVQTVLAKAAATELPAEATRMPQEASNGRTTTVVPPTVPALPESFLPLAHGFCQYLQAQFGAKLEEAAVRMTKEVGVTMDGMARYTQGVLQSNEHVGYQLSDALLKLHEHGLEVRSSPYEMTLQVYTPAGIPLTLTIRKTSAADLLDELTRLETWCALHSYTGEKPAEVAC